MLQDLLSIQSTGRQEQWTTVSSSWCPTALRDIQRDGKKKGRETRRREGIGVSDVTIRIGSREGPNVDIEQSYLDMRLAHHIRVRN